MKSFVAGAVLAASVGSAYADLCSDGSQEIGGNWFCQPVTGMSFTGIASSGSYNKVSNMDVSNHVCSHEPYGYSGSVAPLNEEVSLHVRGPINFNRFAAYSPSGSGSSRKHRRHLENHARRHRHIPKIVEDAEKPDVEKRGDVVVVTATSPWPMTFTMTVPDGGYPLANAPPATPVPATPEAAPTTTSVVVAAKNYIANIPSAEPDSTSPAHASHSSSPSKAPSPGSWSQNAHYEASSGNTHGMTFLGNHGGAGSGVSDLAWGASLSYLASDGVHGAASPEILAAQTVPSFSDFAIMTDRECDNDCGVTRPGSVAYHGFDGPEKAFFFEFSMPTDEANASVNGGNMPAIWMLNAQIPRTMQYGNCTCWPACGEFDIFEVLNGEQPSCQYAKATLHGNPGFLGGDSDYFERPTDPSNPITVGVVMYDSNIHVQVMKDFDWSSSLDSSKIENICQSTMTNGNGVSLFAVAPGA